MQVGACSGRLCSPPKRGPSPSPVQNSKADQRSMPQRSAAQRTSRASALVIALSVYALAFTRLASRLGVTCGRGDSCEE